MALLTDGNPNDIEALRVYEAAILDVASVETIDLNAKLRLATEEISQDVVSILLDHTSLNYTLLNPIAPFGAPANLRRRLGVSDVVVTDPLKRWHALHTLEVTYRDAYNNQLNDRYGAKWDEYRELAAGARVRTIKYGIGLVSQPVPRAGQPTFSVVTGLIPSTIYYVRASWVSATGQEGSASEITTYQTADGSLLVLTAGIAPPVATGWNVYLGLAAWPVALQNSAPMAIGQTFQMPATGLAAGRGPGDGQSPDVYVTGGWTLNRG
jgi:hypothetical protein